MGSVRERFIHEISVRNFVNLDDQCGQVRAPGRRPGT
jgi:hypothetical protein